MAWCSLLDSRWNAIPFAVGAIGLCLATARPAGACPSCPTSRMVGAQAFGPGFWTTLLEVSAPVPVFVLLVTYLHRLGRP